MMDPGIFVGCCGAYCKTCKPYIEGSCMGCKLGYDTKERDINKAKCSIKLCCFRDRKLATCADCPDLDSCRIMKDFYSKKGYKYARYKKAIEYVRAHGYEEFLRHARKWKGAYGKLD